MFDNNGIGRPKRRKIIREIGMAQLHHTLRPGHIAQLVSSQIGQPCIGRQPVDHHLLRRCRQDRLAAVREIAQSRRAIHRRADVIALVSQLHLTGVQTDTQPDRRERRRLQFERTRHRVGSARERGDEAVAFALLDGPHTTVIRDDLRDGAIQPADRGCHLVVLRRPQPGRALDVGKKQRHRSRR